MSYQEPHPHRCDTLAEHEEQLVMIDRLQDKIDTILDEYQSDDKMLQEYSMEILDYLGARFWAATSNQDYVEMGLQMRIAITKALYEIAEYQAKSELGYE